MLLIAGFEPSFSGVVINRSSNCAQRTCKECLVFESNNLVFSISPDIITRSGLGIPLPLKSLFVVHGLGTSPLALLIEICVHILKRKDKTVATFLFMIVKQLATGTGSDLK